MSIIFVLFSSTATSSKETERPIPFLILIIMILVNAVKDNMYQINITITIKFHLKKLLNLLYMYEIPMKRVYELNL